MDKPVFLEDIYPANLLYAITIRSSCAKGSIKFINYPELPEHYSIITAADIPGENRLEDTSMPILADNKIFYIGEPVALLIGQDKTRLEEIAALCSVIAEEEEPVFDNPLPVTQVEENETASVREILIGDPQGVFENAGKIVADSYVTGIQDHWYAEPVGAIASFTSRTLPQEKANLPDVKNVSSAVNEILNGEKNNNESKTDEAANEDAGNVLLIKTATQWPYHVKRSVVRVLGIEPSLVLVEPTDLNLHMDGKLSFASLTACHAALGAFLTKRPVRLILNRREDFLYSPKRCKTNIDIASTIDNNGNITATEIEIAVNVGAYGVNEQEILDQVCLGAIGSYNFSNLKLKARANRSNIPPQGPLSGFGIAQGAFAIERHVSKIADFVCQDPARWRKEYAVSNLVLPSNVLNENHAVIDELIESTAKMSDYYRKWASYELLRQSRKIKPLNDEKGENPRGIGIAIGFQGCSLLYHGMDNGIYSVEVTLTKDSSLDIKTSITSSDGDFRKIWAKSVSEILAIDKEKVRIISTNAPDCGPSCSSRNITVITNLVEQCCHDIRKQRFHDPLPITVSRSTEPRYGALWNGRFIPPKGLSMDINSFSNPGIACAVVEVAIDIAESIPRIRGAWMGVDGGKIISKHRAKRNLDRSVAQALGWAYTENIEYAHGVLPKNNYDNYAILSYYDIPPIEINFFGKETGEPKGIGELPFTCIPAAFLQAVSQAMDHCFKSIPLKRKEIWEMIRIRNAGA
ncbi:MAG: molybdopterin-dependent oxidoreductase [Treponema sp.]|jgi:CO/xanthine dehydrogenase Mo-binding subunit|nr:molybdopterin-dependent oxidoreductase [Treponema sp.]